METRKSSIKQEGTVKYVFNRGSIRTVHVSNSKESGHPRLQCAVKMYYSKSRDVQVGYRKYGVRVDPSPIPANTSRLDNSLRTIGRISREEKRQEGKGERHTSSTFVEVLDHLPPPCHLSGIVLQRRTQTHTVYTRS